MSDDSVSDDSVSDDSVSDANRSGVAEDAPESGTSSDPPPASRGLSEWRTPILLFVATCASTLWIGAQMEGVADPGLRTIWMGWTFALPLMAILLCHEMGHYIAGRIHHVDTSPPFFIPMPFSLLGTMGAVIRMRGRIRSRNALLDIGASGPLAGMAVALPVLIYGVATSEVAPLTADAPYIVEGHSILYEAVLFALKGTIPVGEDIMLSPTALAGWAGLLVTMINMIPFGQLDGGHVAYALLGKKQDRVSVWVVRLLPLVALAVSAIYFLPGYFSGAPGYINDGNLFAGTPWLVWWVILLLMSRYGGSEHPPTDDDVLSPGRRRVAIGTLVLFILLFMPAMVRSFAPG